MKSKKLLVLIAILAAVVVVIVVFASVFSVKDVVVVYHNFDGSLAPTPEEGAISDDEMAELAMGKGIVFLSKNKLLSQANGSFKDWHAFAVVKNFPNVVEVHVVKRTAMLKIDIAGEEVYIDSFGYVVAAPESGRVIDATSAFKGTDAKTRDIGKKFEFSVAENNDRLNYVLEALIATWRCYVEIPDLPAILAEQNLFAFDEDGNMLITPSAGGTIKVMSPSTNLTKRLIKAFGVYYNEYTDLKSDDWVITVRKDGKVTTPDPDKK